jgi:hypothetical protein
MRSDDTVRYGCENMVRTEKDKIVLNTSDSSVGIAMSYGLEDRVSMPGRGKTFFSTLQSPDALAPRQSPIQ